MISKRPVKVGTFFLFDFQWPYFCAPKSEKIVLKDPAKKINGILYRFEM